jgi:hypothetical protein
LDNPQKDPAVDTAGQGKKEEVVRKVMGLLRRLQGPRDEIAQARESKRRLEELRIRERLLEKMANLVGLPLLRGGQDLKEL